MNALIDSLVLFSLASFLPTASASAVQISQLNLNVDPSEVTVSGLSSGGFMSVQLHVAHSGSIKGSAPIAAGPYYCSGGIFANLKNCMSEPENIELNQIISLTKAWADDALIDSTSNLQSSPVYAIWPNKDAYIAEDVMNKLHDFYQHFGADITYNKDIEAPHAFITDKLGLECASTDAPYVVNCGFDAAGAILSKLYGELKPRASVLSGTFHEFDQSEFFLEPDKPYGIAKSGWLYVPSDCRKAVCKLIMVLHGCTQNLDTLGNDAVIKQTGYNEWADTNEIIVIYPQTSNIGTTNGCWDWWGDQGDVDSYVHKTGRHVSTLKRIIDGVTAKRNSDQPKTDL